MPHGPYWDDLPLDSGTPPKAYVSKTPWNLLVDNIVNWQADRNAGGFDLGNVGELSCTSLKLGTTSSAGGNFVYTGGAAYLANASSAAASDRFIFTLGRSRGSVGSPSAVLSGDMLGGMGWGGFDGSDWAPCWQVGEIIATATENWSGSAHGIKMSFSVAANGDALPTQRMVLGPDGKLGIGVDPAVVSGTGLFHHVGNTARVTGAARTVSSSGESGNVGEIAIDDSYLYVRQTSGWRRVALGGTF